MIAVCDPASSEAQLLMRELTAALAAITGDGGSASFAIEDVTVPRSLFAIARDADGVALGCVALRPVTEEVGEIKRMYARPGSRVGAALLAFVEAEARSFGYRSAWLETRRVNSRAVAFYQRHGYREIAPYDKYIGRLDAICLGKPIA